ncbi:microtubule-associated protein 6 homolog isoform X1 [Sinocyclocheilus grahami]|uniref:Microtubule-associated protein 6 homolog n=1 Tax=Sinocyclocheilus grahami TaxID=75366 RepID=A0A672LIJ1_SINGR|nr:PREDICTED: microtubule-associated protein 6 homolog isoform X1 [Sinocyclocheilus grahami]
MAWPCITRACCINRFWSEFDKGDIAVPLVFTKYSDVAEVQHLHPQPKPLTSQKPVVTESQPAHSAHQEASTGATHAAADAAASSSQDGSGASVMREDFKAWSVRPERSCKPRNEFQPSKAPFSNVTQYQKDYKPWPIPKKGDHPWIPKQPTPAAPCKAESKFSKQEQAAAEVDTGVEKCEIEEKQHEKESKERRKKVDKEEHVSEGIKMEQDAAVEGKKRSAADALNRQIKEEVTSGSSYRTEFKAYRDVKQVKPIKAKSQYKLLAEEKTSLETSYSATFKGEQVKPQATDNKLLERRRIRSLYSEPSKDSSKVERHNISLSKPKKTTSHSKTVKKAKEKPIAGSQAAKKKTSESNQEPKPEGGVTKKSKEMINRLAEAKD